MNISIFKAGENQLLFKKKNIGIYCCIFLSILIAGFALNLCLNPRYATVFTEYYIKYLPALISGNFYTIFDTALLGDPRPRLLSSVLTILNINMRESLYTHNLFLPTLSINWLIYPLSILGIYISTLMLWKNRFISISTTLIYAASPGALDMLCDYYIPSKPLILLITILSFSYFYKVLVNYPSISLKNYAKYSVLIILGLLSDETAFFIPLFLLAIFINSIFQLNLKNLFCLIGLTIAPYFLFLVFAVFLFPQINDALIQTKLNLILLATKGIFFSLFEFTTLAPFEWSPLSFLDIIMNGIATFIVPFRNIPGGWTATTSYSFANWGLLQKLTFLTALTLLIFLYLSLDKYNKNIIKAISLGFIIFTLGQTILSIPLAPYIREFNYYANQSSIWISLGLGILIGSAGKINFTYRYVLLILVVLTELVNFNNSLSSNPFYSKLTPTHSQIQKILFDVKDNKFNQIVMTYKFPDHEFKYGLEMEIFRRKLNNETIDLVPYGVLNSSIFAYLPALGTQDERLSNQDIFQNKVSQGEILDSSQFSTLVKNKKIRGKSGEWTFIRTFNDDDTFLDKAWYQGLVRVWTQRGRLEDNGNSTCLIFSSSHKECFSSLWRTNNHIVLAYDNKNNLVFSFKILDQ